MENKTPTQDVSPLVSASDNSTLISVLTLLFINPFGVFYMWWKASWHIGVKITVTVFSVISWLIMVPLVAGVILLAVNPAGQNALKTGIACGQQCQTAPDVEACTQACVEQNLNLEFSENETAPAGTMESGGDSLDIAR